MEKKGSKASIFEVPVFKPIDAMSEFGDEMELLPNIHGSQALLMAKKQSYQEKYKASIAVRRKYLASETILGVGSFGSVLLFQRKAFPQIDVAVKIIRKEKCDTLQMKIMQDELNIMTTFDHEHVIKHIESYEDKRYIFIVMEALTDSVELNEVMKNKRFMRNFEEKGKRYNEPLFDEKTVQWIMRALCSGLNHIHSNGVVHRDIKLANILVDSKQEQLKIIDFGMAKKMNSNQEGGLLIGTIEYVSPEIFRTRGAPRAYAPPCDMWAVGIIMYQLFTGLNPFKK